MKLLRKVLFGTITPVVVVAVIATMAVAFILIRETRERIVSQYRDIANYLAKEVEVGYYESKWPFENLQTLAGKKEFLFWWIIDNEGTIYLADKEAFIGTDSRQYFPNTKMEGEEGFVTINNGESGVYFKKFRAGDKAWAFWTGVSLTDLQTMTTQIILVSAALVLICAGTLAGAIYLIVRKFMNPVTGLVKGNQAIMSGDLSYRITNAKKSGDELEYLADTFNQMAIRLEEFYTDLEKKVKERTETLEQAKMQIEEKAKELERMNAMMIGRENKMIELKQKIAELEAIIANSGK